MQELCTRALLSVDDSVSSACGRVLSHLIMQEGKKAAMRMAPWQLYIEVRQPREDHEFPVHSALSCLVYGI